MYKYVDGVIVSLKSFDHTTSVVASCIDVYGHLIETRRLAGIQRLDDLGYFRSCGVCSEHRLSRLVQFGDTVRMATCDTCFKYIHDDNQGIIYREGRPPFIIFYYASQIRAALYEEHRALDWIKPSNDSKHPTSYISQVRSYRYGIVRNRWIHRTWLVTMMASTLNTDVIRYIVTLMMQRDEFA